VRPHDEAPDALLNANPQDRVRMGRYIRPDHAIPENKGASAAVLPEQLFLMHGCALRLFLTR
jgi:hypothetical protein